MSGDRLHLYENGVPDWVVAYDAEDAHEVWCETTGEDPADHTFGDWKQIPDGRIMKFWMTEDGELAELGEGTLTEMTAAQVVEKFGHGFWASSEA